MTPEVKLSTSSGSEAITWPSSRLGSYSSKPHAPSKDARWDAVGRFEAEFGQLGLNDLRFIRRVGSGDIGSVYLVEIKGAEGCVFAAKVMDKEELASRCKESRANIEREILEMLDHPFLPALYATLDSDRWSCLLTEFCPGGDLHILRQQQPDRRFNEAAVRFYASEVVVAFEYLHMMGIIYRDLKPENVLIRSDGHIMLTDFDLCLKCDNSTPIALVKDQATLTKNSLPLCTVKQTPLSRILPNCKLPNIYCLRPRRTRRLRPSHHGLIDIVAEPIDTRSMSFVGTHEYLSPEIVSGEGHGNAVDWWTLGIFMYEMFYGVTPFRGVDNEFTLGNIVARAVEFPKEPAMPSSMKDLISQLLTKDPMERMGSTTGAAALKHHPFFQGVNWALLRCTTPPSVPKAVVQQDVEGKKEERVKNNVEYY
ncbi:hypothetical protein DCAR_0207164 [Daucus carota subsp. sativus]|uniref:non-specific serine/threonine protein kinase n=2 Tax=Daucus carota subsp. sativus TaxID=79200 RepID=A0AAF1APT1_DAUCS|nr:PREDICTED: serine/threonine-protein kinase D6PK-like [Daucus carota subsp. sativus]WOG87931.1 hypothetical protein DCAR_0207164 [Daucus carota subsp. sativus]